MNCIICNNSLKRNSTKFCSKSCESEFKIRISTKKILNGESVSATTQRRILRKIKEHRCEICNNSTWMNKPIPLILDHIDGNSYNNLMENLRFVCGNCDSQLPTYKNKNKGNGRHERMKRYRDGRSY